ncbi:MAG TPA: alpha/beta fold hydrolase [Blastocatellia bacterium]|jgi:medium-chain acyl-[acyl-carrier-protein] hydrolase|nr:alpha/beta fold hydrolase [Blastocatellia bacterium]
MSKTVNQWVSFPKPRPGAGLRLFCFPYAGGNTLIFRSWVNALPEGVEACPVQLPGRGPRLAEKRFTRLLPLAHAIAEGILPYCNKPFAMFGHSMGAMLSFEVARYLRAHSGIEPVQLFVSGRRAPQIPDTDAPTYNLPEPEFIQELKRIQGTPQEVLDNDELMQLFLPVLRADFEVCQTYLYTPGEPLNCPISAYCGLEDDEENRERMQAWREQTVGHFSLRMFPGGHFFLHSSERMLLHMLSRETQQLAQGQA